MRETGETGETSATPHHDVRLRAPDGPPPGRAATDAPRRRPLTYPGAWPDRSVLVAGDHEWAVDLPPGSSVGAALVDDGPGGRSLDDVLLGLGVAPIADREPVLAVGSNASTAQLRHKAESTDMSPVVPMLRAQVRGVMVGVAPKVFAPGYVPAAPVFDPAARAMMFVQWLDAAQLDALDRTERAYDRRELIGRNVSVELPSGASLGRCFGYVATLGYLVDDADEPIALPPDQTALLTDLLSRSPRLRELMGPTPAAWIRTVREGGRPVATEVERIFAAEGWVRSQF
ncbi:MAG TPA: hypothetical protein VIP77_02145 [Jiangellaceae bacterium]